MTNHSELSQPPIYKWILFTAALVYIITAYNSYGYFAPDEQFHIIEFANLKSGLHQVSDMPWGYAEEFRSTLQPTICYFLFKLLNFLNITDEYVLSFFLRLLSAFTSLLIIHYFIRSTEHLIQHKNAKIAYYLLSYFTWFVPFVSVRFSAEAWGGLFFLTAFIVYFNPKISSRKFFLAGCMLGLSFLFRFQMAFASFGFVLWLIVIDKATFKQIIHLIAGGLLVALLGNLLDCWFYGHTEFTLWNYLYAFYDNTANHGSSRFGTSPWYAYLEELFRIPGYFLGACYILAIAILLIAKPKNIFIWSFLVFFIIHSFIPHKEERFLFPVIYLLPVILIAAYEIMLPFFNGFLKITIQYVFLPLLILINCTGLIAVSTSLAGNGKMAIVQYIHAAYGEKPINLIQSNWGDVYDKHTHIIPYNEKKINRISIDNLCNLTDSVIVKGVENLLVIQKRSLELKSCAASLDENHFIMKKQSVPVWVEWLNDNVYNGFDKLDIYVLYQKEH